MVAGLLQSAAGLFLVLLASIVRIVGYAIFVGFVVRLVQDVRDGRRDHSVGDLFAAAAPAIVPLIGFGILSGIGVGIGFFLLIVPGLILLTIWSVGSPAIVAEGAGVIDAFGRSWELVRGNGWSVFGTLLLVLLIVIVVQIVLAAIATPIGTAAILIAAIISSVITAPDLRARGQRDVLRPRRRSGDRRRGSCSCALSRPASMSASRPARPRAPRSPGPRTRSGRPRRGVPTRSTILTKQGRTRVKELLPIRHGRMAVSPFTFFRGAAAVMAADLATTPVSGLRAQVCGDAHLANFGVFAAPDRSLVFDLNDFDESLPGPWEWDVKRLGASFEIAARSNGFKRKERTAVVATVGLSYREAMRGFAKHAEPRGLVRPARRRDGDGGAALAGQRNPPQSGEGAGEGPRQGQPAGARQPHP